MAYNAILSADLSEGLDVDDWFDALTYLLIPNITRLGIICDFYATDPVKTLAEELVTLVDLDAVTVKKGLLPADKDWTCTGGSCGFCTTNEGVAHYLSVLNALGTGEKLRIVCGGGYTTEAAAHRCNSALVEDKVEYIYMVASGVGGTGSTNFSHDEESAIYVTNSAIPKIWIASSLQYTSAKFITKLFSRFNRVSNFMRDRVDAWRTERGLRFLADSDQLPLEGKNIWSIPAFVDLADQSAGLATYETGTMSYNTGTGLLEWAASVGGRDKILLSYDDDAMVDWMFDLYMADATRYPFVGYTP
jgi:hypothetical protein